MQAAETNNPQSTHPPIHRDRNLIAVLVGIIGLFLISGFAFRLNTDGLAFGQWVDRPSLVLVLVAPVAVLMFVYGWAGFVDACSYLFRRPSHSRSAMDAVSFFHLWAAFAMAAGFSTTLIRQIKLLASLHSSSHLGPSIAAALLSQLYGVLIAVICISLAAYVARRHNGPEQLFTRARHSTSVAGITVIAGSMTILMTLGILMLSMSPRL